jgi:hypothetical protein
MILRVNIILLHVSLSHVAIAEKLTKLKFLIFSRQESAHIEKKMSLLQKLFKCSPEPIRGRDCHSKETMSQ